MEIQCREHIFSLNNKRSIIQFQFLKVTINIETDDFKLIVTKKKINSELRSQHTYVTVYFVFLRNMTQNNVLLALKKIKLMLKKHGLCFKYFRAKHLARDCWGKICAIYINKVGTIHFLYENQVFNNSQADTKTKNKNSDAISTTVSNMHRNKFK